MSSHAGVLLSSAPSTHNSLCGTQEGEGLEGDMTLTTVQKAQAPSLVFPSCPGHFLLLCLSLVLSSEENPGADDCSFLP